MKSGQKRTLQSFRRVMDWIFAWLGITTAAPGTNTAAGTSTATPAPAAGTPAANLTAAQVAAMQVQLSTLHGVVQNVTAAAAEQDAQAKVSLGATAQAQALRAELLVHHMRPIAKLAKVAIPDVVKMEVALKAPAADRDTEALLASAEAMAKASEHYRDTLIARGLPVDFVEQLRTVAAAYKQEFDARGQAKGAVTKATTVVRTDIVSGRKAVEAMSVIVTKALRNDPATLAQWHQIKRVTIKGVQPAIVPAGTTPAATPPPFSRR